MKIAIKKDKNFFGHSYLLYPRLIEESEVQTFVDQGFEVLEIEDQRGERLVKASSDALVHQVEIGDLLEMENGKKI